MIVTTGHKSHLSSPQYKVKTIRESLHRFYFAILFDTSDNLELEEGYHILIDRSIDRCAG